MTLSKAGELRDRGFTLIELLVVCGILAALSFVAWSGYSGVQANAEDDIARSDMQRLADALRRFKADTGYYPGQGPFVLASTGTVETASGTGGFDCSGGAVLGVLRSWAPTPDSDTDKDAWFASPANLAMLFEAPPLCANHPLGFLQRWNPETRRGWHGPYLGLASRHWVDHGADFNTDLLGTGSPDGQGSPVLGAKLLDIPALGAGPRYRANNGVAACGDQGATSGACELGWRTVARETVGYNALLHELPAFGRPLATFGLASGNAPRVVYFGRDGRYGGRNLLNPCQPNLTDADGEDDVVLCLGA